jgi:hypothetical protein
MYEDVLTMTDYYDGPRCGIALYQDAPHLYQSRWSDIHQQSEDTFLLMPLSEDVVRLALEDWAIWERWETAFHSGKTTQATHPALPEDTNRHKQLESLLKEKLILNEANTFCAKAKFRTAQTESNKLGMKQLVVEWELVSCTEYPDYRVEVSTDD